MTFFGRCVRRAVACALILIAITMVAAIGLFVRLGAGPVELPMRDRLLAQASQALAPGLSLDASGAELALFEGDGLSGLRLKDVVISDQSGSEIVRAPKLGLKFEIESYFDRQVALREAEVEGLALDIVREVDGQIRLDIGNGESTLDLADFTNGSGGGAVPALRFANSALQYRDAKTGARFETRDAELIVDPEAEGLEATLSATLTLEDGASAVINATFDQADEMVRGTAEFQDLEPSGIAAYDTALSSLSELSFPISGKLNFEVPTDDRSDVLSISGDVKAPRGGIVKIAGTDRPFNALSGRFDFDAATGRIVTQDLSFSAPNLIASGDIQAERTESGNWTVEAVFPEFSALSDAGKAKLRDLAITASVSSEARAPIIFEQIEAAALHLQSSDGLVDAQNLSTSGVFEPASGSLTLGSLSGDGVTLSQNNGSRVEIGSFKTAMSAMTRDNLILAWRNATLKDVVADGPGGKISVASAVANINFAAATGALQIERLGAGGIELQQAKGNGLTVQSLTLVGWSNLRSKSFELSKLSAQDVVVLIPDRYDHPLRSESLSARVAGRSDQDGLRLQLRDTDARFDGMPVNVGGDFLVRRDSTVVGRLSSTVGPAESKRVAHFWPKRVAPGAREWVVRNLRAGMLNDVRIDAAFDTITRGGDSMTIDFGFEKAEVSISGELPHVRDGRGRGRATLKAFIVEVDEARVEVPGEGSFAIGPSRLNVPAYKPRPAQGHLDLAVTGPVRSILRFLDAKPLGIISKSNFQIDTADATVSGKVKLRLPLVKEMRFADVRYSAAAEIQDFRFLEPNTSLPVSGDRLRLKVQQEGLSLQGDARIDGLATRISYQQHFQQQDADKPSSRLTAKSFLQTEDFARRGLDVSSYINGLVAVDVTADLFKDGSAQLWIEGDATSADLKADIIGWSKPAGEPIMLRAKGRRLPDGRGAIEHFEVGGAASGSGSMVFNSVGSLQSAEIQRLTLPDRFDAALRYQRTGDGGARIELEGPLVDLRAAFARAIDSSSATRPAPPRKAGPATDIAMRVGVARLRDDLNLHALSGGLRMRGKKIEAAKVNARANDRAPFQLLAERRSDGLALDMRSNNAGAFLETASVFSGAHGGNLHFNGRTRDAVLPTRISGQVEINGIEVRDSKTLSSIFKGGSIASLVRQMTSSGLRFDRVSLPFRGIGGRWQIEDGLAHGPAVGLTVTGEYDIGRKGIDLHGTVSPAYAINGALGAVPVLGEFLTGGEGEGVFGVTFNVSGTTEKPNVWVNPLSAIAPGFLRKIVSGLLDRNPEIDRSFDDQRRPGR